MINVICGLLFVGFCFCYLAFYQGDFIALIQHYYSHGRNVSHGIILPALITLGLTILGGLIQFFAHIPIRLRALHWVPSFILLSMLTSIGVGNFTAGDSSHGWIFYLVTLAVFLIAYYVALTIQENRSENNSFVVYLWPNLLIFSISCTFLIFTSNTNRRLHEELRIERAIGEGRWEDAQKRVKQQKQTTAFMSAMYVYATNEMGELSTNSQFFQYLTEKGSDKLLPSLKDSLRPWNVTAMVREKLGNLPATDMNATRYLEYILRDTLATPQVKQWLMTSYLVDRDLPSFTKQLLECYPPLDSIHHVYTAEDSLPKNYREALYVYTHQYEHPEATIQDSLLDVQYDQFKLFNYNLTVPEKIASDSLSSYWKYYFSR